MRKRIPTFADMRGDRTRSHVMLHELVAAAADRGVSWRRNRLLKEIAHVGRPAVKRYGHLHYGREHLQAVIEAAERQAARRAKP